MHVPHMAPEIVLPILDCHSTPWLSTSECLRGDIVSRALMTFKIRFDPECSVTPRIIALVFPSVLLTDMLPALVSWLRCC